MERMLHTKSVSDWSRRQKSSSVILSAFLDSPTPGFFLSPTTAILPSVFLSLKADSKDLCAAVAEVGLATGEEEGDF